MTDSHTDGWVHLDRGGFAVCDGRPGVDLSSKVGEVTCPRCRVTPEYKARDEYRAKVIDS